jgi:hypothetical protein
MLSTWNLEGHVSAPQWSNPLAQLPVDRQPFLDDVELPYAGDRYVAEPIRLLDLFYSDERQGDNRGLRALTDFILSPHQKRLILFGEVGVGKTWFTRNFLLRILPSIAPGSMAGIIDLRSDPYGDLVKTVHMQLDRILRALIDENPGLGIRTALARELDSYMQQVFPHLPPGDCEYSDRIDQRIQSLYSLDDRVTANSERLRYFEPPDRPNLFLLIDNIDTHEVSKQRALGLNVKDLINFPGVYLIVTLRRETCFGGHLDPVLRDLDLGVDLEPLKIDSLLAKRFAHSVDGADISHVLLRDDRGETCTLREIMDRFTADPRALNLIEKLSGHDIRHVIRFARRYFFSKQLKSLSNVGNPYYCLSALMLRNTYFFDPKHSYVLNLYDNRRRNDPGNGLIRHRVLDYFIEGNAAIGGAALQSYFQERGYSPQVAADVVGMFLDHGLLRRRDPAQVRISGQDEADLTIMGYHYDKLKYLLWYTALVRKGMWMDRDLLQGRFVTDDSFVEFVRREEEEEAERIRIAHGDVEVLRPVKLSDLLSGELKRQNNLMLESRERRAAQERADVESDNPVVEEGEEGPVADFDDAI